MKVFALLGVVWTVLLAYVFASWISADYFGPTPTGPEVPPASTVWFIRILEGGMTLLTLRLIWDFIVQPLRKDGEIGADGAVRDHLVHVVVPRHDAQLDRAHVQLQLVRRELRQLDAGDSGLAPQSARRTEYACSIASSASRFRWCRRCTLRVTASRCTGFTPGGRRSCACRGCWRSASVRERNYAGARV